MRHSIFTFIGAAAATVALFSCAKEVDLKNQIEPEVKGFKVNVIAGDETKTYVEDGTIPVVKWSTSDKIVLIESMDGAVQGSGISDAANIPYGLASFSTTIDWDATGGSSYTYSAVYPTDAFVFYNSKYYLVMPDEQILEGNNMSLDSDILFSLVDDRGATRVADGEEIMFSFRRLGTVVRMGLKGIVAGEKIRKVIIEAPAYVAGAIEYDPVTSTVDPTTAFVDLASNVITLNVNDLVATGTEDVVFFRVLSERDWGQSGDQLSIKVITDKSVYEKNLSTCPTMKFPDGGLTKFGVTLGSSRVEPLAVPYSENFESGFDGWTIIDADGDGYAWQRGTTAVSGYVGREDSDALVSASYINNVGALNPDNWAFTPGVQLTTGNYLSFWVRSMDINYPYEHYEVYITDEVPLEGNLSSCTRLLAESAFPYGDFVEFDEDGYEHVVIPIPASFNNKVVYIGFRHFNCTDQYWIKLDDVSIVKGKPVLDAVVGTGNYSDYLGEWVDPAGAIDITIAAKASGISYSITGLPGLGINAVEATFENGCLVLREQEISLSVGESEVLQSLFVDESNSTGCHYFYDESQKPILYASYSGGDLSILTAPKHVSAGIISYVSSSPSSLGTVWTIPSLLSPPSLADYTDYLGKWIDGDTVYTISEKVNGSTYTISGFVGSIPVEGVFLGGRIAVYEQLINSDLAFEGLYGGSYFKTSYDDIGSNIIFTISYKDTPELTVSAVGEYNGYIWLNYSGSTYSSYASYSMTLPGVMAPYVAPTYDIPYTNDFEDNITDWTIFDVNEDSYSWGLGDRIVHSGSYALISYSYSSAALTPDNYIFTPAIKLTTNNYLSFWVDAQQSYYEEHYGVYITTDEPELSNLSSCELLFEQTYSTSPTDAYATGADGYQRYLIQVPAAYANKTVYFGFRHFNCTDMYYLQIDDVAVTEGEPTVFSAPKPRLSAAPMRHDRSERTGDSRLQPMPTGPGASNMCRDAVRMVR